MKQYLADMVIEIDDNMTNVKVSSNPETIQTLQSSIDSDFFMDAHVVSGELFIQTLNVTDVYQITNAISEARFD